MKIQLRHADPSLVQALAADVQGLFADAGLAGGFESSMTTQGAGEPVRGVDPVTLTTIVLTAVGAGGALTVALGKEGFLTRLAKVLEAWVRREVEVRIEDPGGPQGAPQRLRVAYRKAPEGRPGPLKKGMPWRRGVSRCSNRPKAAVSCASSTPKIGSSMSVTWMPPRSRSC